MLKVWHIETNVEEVRMSRKRFTPEQIIGILREADVKLSQGRSVEQLCRELSITEQSYYRWRKEYGGMKTAQAQAAQGSRAGEWASQEGGSGSDAG